MKITIKALKAFLNSRSDIGEGIRHMVMDGAWIKVSKGMVPLSELERFKEYLPRDFFEQISIKQDREAKAPG